MLFNRVFFILSGLLVVCSPAFAEIHHLGKFGKTYPIEERDAIEDIKERAGNLDYESLARSVSKRIKDFRPENLSGELPDAEKEESHLVDMTYVLKRDIYDDKGNLLYPKGYSFNPLDYVKLPTQYLFLNGNKESHLRWFKESEFYNKVNVTLLITDGSYYDLMEKFKRPVFYATRRIIQRMGIKHLPSLARQKGNMLEVIEYQVKEEKTDAKN